VAKSELAGFPAASQCRVCHPRNPAFQGDKSPFPARRIYTLPDFVFFSHAKHVAAKVECGSCHAQVYEHDLPGAEVRFKMKTCVDCHKASSVTLACTACHELSQ
jgi:hypothetical protein